MIKTLWPARIATNYILVSRDFLQACKSQVARLYYELPADETSRAAGGNSIESKRGREEDWKTTNQEKEIRLKKKAKRRQTAEAA